MNRDWIIVVHSKATRDRYARENPDCEKCGRSGSAVHHLLRGSGNRTDQIWNLVVLCEECHKRAHDEARPLPYLPALVLYRIKIRKREVPATVAEP